MRFCPTHAILSSRPGVPSFRFPRKDSPIAARPAFRCRIRTCGSTISWTTVEAVLLLDFMETNCPKCKELSVKLEAVKKKYGRKVGVLSIVITPPETQATVAKYIAETKITTPILFDSSQVAISYFKATPQNPTFDTPHLFAINRNGLIVKDWAQAGHPGSGVPGRARSADRWLAGQEIDGIRPGYQTNKQAPPPGWRTRPARTGLLWIGVMLP